MKKVVLLILLGLLVSLSMAAQQFLDVVHLKNGGMVKGVIIEQVPGESLKIQTADGSVFVYQMSEVEKISKEAVQQKQSNLQSNSSGIQIDPNGQLTWKDGKLYMDDTLLNDQTARQLMGLEMWDKYDALNKSYNLWDDLGTTGLWIGVLGVDFLLAALIWNNETLLLGGCIGLGVGALCFFPAIICSHSYAKRIEPIINEYNYGKPSYSMSMLSQQNWALVPQMQRPIDASQLLPSYTQLFSFKINF